MKKISCSECNDRGYIKVWHPGRPETTHMARCEQCSGTIQQMRGACRG